SAVNLPVDCALGVGGVAAQRAGEAAEGPVRRGELLILTAHADHGVRHVVQIVERAALAAARTSERRAVGAQDQLIVGASAACKEQRGGREHSREPLRAARWLDRHECCDRGAPEYVTSDASARAI